MKFSLRSLVAIVAICAMSLFAGEASAQSCCHVNAIVAAPIYSAPLVQYVAPVVQLQQVVQAPVQQVQQVQQIQQPQHLTVPTVPVLNFVQYQPPVYAQQVQQVNYGHSARIVVNPPFHVVREQIRVVQQQRQRDIVVIRPRQQEQKIVVVNGRRR